MLLREQLLESLQLVEADPSIESVELSGAGPAWCSGGDLDEFGTATDLVAAAYLLPDRNGGLRRHRRRSAERLFRFPEVDMGLVPGAGATVSVPRRVGRWRAVWLMLSGVRLESETALRWGLVDRLNCGIGGRGLDSIALGPPQVERSNGMSTCLRQADRELTGFDAVRNRCSAECAACLRRLVSTYLQLSNASNGAKNSIINIRISWTPATKVMFDPVDAEIARTADRPPGVVAR
jgi:hypothetical protein